jgi:hypothetical protein
LKIAFIAILIFVFTLFSQTDGISRFEIGLDISAFTPTDGKLHSANYSDKGGWTDYTLGRAGWDILSMKSDWTIKPGMNYGGGGFIGFWFKGNFGARISADYAFVSSIENVAQLTYDLHDTLFDSTFTCIREYDSCPEKSRIASLEIAPTLIYIIDGDSRRGFGLTLAPSLFFDNADFYLDLPIAYAKEVNDTFRLFTNVAPSPLHYKSSEFSMGLTAGILVTTPISEKFSLDGLIFITFSDNPIYKAENYDISYSGEAYEISPPDLTIEGKADSFIRSAGIKLSVGFSL